MAETVNSVGTAKMRHSARVINSREVLPKRQRVLTNLEIVV